jgi:hypothetical protein
MPPPEAQVDHALALPGEPVHLVDAGHGAQHRLQPFVDAVFDLPRRSSLPVGTHHQVGRIHIRQQVDRQLLQCQPAEDKRGQDQDDGCYGAVEEQGYRD